MKHLLIQISLFISFCFTATAQTTNVISVESSSMHKSITNLVILPSDYDKSKNLPVVYLLHGFGDNHETWIKMVPNLPTLANQLHLIFVCPDVKKSWYIDSPIDSTQKYETYVAKELTAFIDGHYKTIPSTKGRAITGFSMGGYGAFYIAIKHQDIFGACGSSSGAIDPRLYPQKWGLSKVLGEYKNNPTRWNSYCISSMLYLIQPELSIIMDCGTEDFLASTNEHLHQQMVYFNIKHDYISRPGIHNADYWRNSIKYHLLFFSEFFKGHHNYQKQLIYKQQEAMPSDF